MQHERAIRDANCGVFAELAQYQPQNAYCHKHRQRCRQNFDVTGFRPISGRNIIYIVQGDELDVFDTNIDTLAPGVTQPT